MSGEEGLSNLILGLIDRRTQPERQRADRKLFPVRHVGHALYLDWQQQRSRWTMASHQIGKTLCSAQTRFSNGRRNKRVVSVYKMRNGRGMEMRTYVGGKVEGHLAQGTFGPGPKSPVGLRWLCAGNAGRTLILLHTSSRAQHPSRHRARKRHKTLIERLNHGQYLSLYTSESISHVSR